MTIKDEDLETRMGRGQKFVAAGGVLGALAASSCCILPLMLFSFGVSGVWIGSFTRLAPYQPYFIATTLLFLGCGYWLVYRSGMRACAKGETCARPLSNRIVKASLILATTSSPPRLVSTSSLPSFSTLDWRAHMNRFVAHAAFVTIIVASPAAMAEDRTITLSVKNMDCAACPSIVKASLQAVPGVAKVAVSFKEKTATVTFDDAKADVNQLTSATTNAGYPSAPKS
jgi:mercuric transport protein